MMSYLAIESIQYSNALLALITAIVSLIILLFTVSKTIKNVFKSQNEELKKSVTKHVEQTITTDFNKKFQAVENSVDLLACKVDNLTDKITTIEKTSLSGDLENLLNVLEISRKKDIDIPKKQIIRMKLLLKYYNELGGNGELEIRVKDFLSAYEH